jgi:hypothetical protein
MTAALTPPPKAQFFAADGTPLVNGRLYSYVAGTTTPLATYVNSAGITQNTNPVILNSRGEANVWLDNGVLYKLALHDATDALIWTVDNVYANNTGIFTGPVAGTTATFSGALTALSGAFSGPVSGTTGTFSGAASASAMTVVPASGAAAVNIRASGAGLDAAVNFSTGSSARWQVTKNTSAESGANAGSDLVVSRYSDAGAVIDSPITVSRANGTVTVGSATGVNFPFVTIGLAAAGTVWNRLANASGSATSTVALSFDPGNNGVNTRDASIRATNNGGNQIQLSFQTSNGAAPYEALRITAAGDVLVTSASGTLGYGTGAGGIVTQSTNKGTGVTLDRATGIITMNNASLASNTTVSFTLTNNKIAIGDVLTVCQGSAGTGGAYQVTCSGVYAGSASISVRNTTAGPLSEALTINFAVIKGASA